MEAERAGAQADVDVEVEAGAEDVIAQQAVLMGLFNGFLQALYGDGILRTNVDPAFVRADGVSADRHGFQDRVGIAFQQGAVHESAGVALVSVADEVLVLRLAGTGKLPLLAGGETGAAAAAQSGLQHFVNDLFGGHLGQRLCQGLVAVKRDIFVDVFGIDHAAVPQRDAHLLLVEPDLAQALLHAGFVGLVIHIDQALDLAAFQQVLGNDLVHVFFLDAAVERSFGINDNHGAGFAETEAARTDHLDFLVKAFFLQLILEAFNQLRGSG